MMVVFFYLTVNSSAGNPLLAAIVDNVDIVNKASHRHTTYVVVIFHLLSKHNTAVHVPL